MIRTWIGWLAGVLLALIVGCEQGPDPAQTSGNFLTLTYNVHGLPPQITGDDTAGRLVQIGPLINAFDVVGLQEDFVDENHQSLADASDHESAERFGEPLEDRFYGSGLSVFARYPVMDYYEEYYERCNGVADSASDCLASKGFQVVTLQLTDGAEVDLYNSHLEAGGDDVDDEIRQEHVDALVASMTGRSAGRAVIFTGDTNLHGDEAMDAPVIAGWLEDAGLTDACESVGCDEPHHIDRVFYRSDGGVELGVDSWTVEDAFYDDEGVPLSDHPAISTGFSWSIQ